MVATARKQPLYDQLVDILADKIEHEYHAGDMISSERELSERYGLSRTTRVGPRSDDHHPRILRCRG